MLVVGPWDKTAGQSKWRIKYIMYKLAVFSTAIFAFFIGWVVYMADTGQKSIFFDLVKMIPFGDKIGHFLLFGFLALGANIVFKLRGMRIGNINLFYGAIVIFVVVVIEEVSQKFMPGRTFDINDIMASLAGIVAFSLIPPGFLLKKQEPGQA
ncbi:MAG: VanZ family protein [Pseudomonadota bacterium]